MHIYFSDRFPAPTCLEEARGRCSELLSEIQDIQMDLGCSKKARDVDQQAKYIEWRDKAKRVLNLKQQQYRFLKAWVRIETQKASTRTPAIKLLQRLYTLVEDYEIPSEDDLSEDETSLLAEVSARVHAFTQDEISAKSYTETVPREVPQPSN